LPNHVIQVDQLALRASLPVERLVSFDDVGDTLDRVDELRRFPAGVFNPGRIVL
jgi:hypothetical protein